MKTECSGNVGLLQWQQYVAENSVCFVAFVPKEYIEKINSTHIRAYNNEVGDNCYFEFREAVEREKILLRSIDYGIT